MVYCAAFDCNNDSRKRTGISYHCFPKDPSLREQWLVKILRADLIISNSTRLCSQHFTPDCHEHDLQAELLGSKKHLWKPMLFHRYSLIDPLRKSLAYRPRTMLLKKQDEVRVWNVIENELSKTKTSFSIIIQTIKTILCPKSLSLWYWYIHVHAYSHWKVTLQTSQFSCINIIYTQHRC